jgi:hypothetical protein
VNVVPLRAQRPREADWGADSLHRGIWLLSRDPLHRQVARHALDLLAEHDRRRFRRVLRYAANVHVGQAGDVGISRYDQGTTRVFIEVRNRLDVAATLVHEATHALLHARGHDYDDRSWFRHESICRAEEARFARRLAAAPAALTPGERDELHRFAAACERLSYEYLTRRGKVTLRDTFYIGGMDTLFRFREELRHAWARRVAQAAR